MRTKLSKASKIMKYIATHPNDKATEVAKALNVNVNSVYQATYLAKKKVMAKRGRPRQIPSTLAPNAVMSMALHADMVNHPSHYKVGGIETIDFIEAKNLGYNLGNVIKYITRADFKGNKLEDLQKAQWYLNREVSKLKGSK